MLCFNNWFKAFGARDGRGNGAGMASSVTVIAANNLGHDTELTDKHLSKEWPSFGRGASCAVLRSSGCRSAFGLVLRNNN
jgi:hypothetical protein